MQFEDLGLSDAYLIRLEKKGDERGHFARTWCEREAAAHGIHVQWVQHSVSYNRRAGTLRGLHHQAEPHPETKLVRCTRGSICDVIVDIRLDSPTFGQWRGVTLTPDNGLMLYIPAGFAHGFQTLADDSEVSYQISAYYHADLQRGVRWDDPSLGITWPPCDERILSPRDRSYPDLQTCLASC